MIKRIILVAACATVLPVSAAHAADDPLGGGLPGVDIAAQATDGVAGLLGGLSALPGVSIGATATCGAANLLWGLAGKHSSACAKPADHAGYAEYPVHPEHPEHPDNPGYAG